MSLEEISGDLLSITLKDGDYIAHQINANSQGGASGVAEAIFAKYPSSDVYKDREKPEFMEKMGTISVYKPVINMLSQYFPGGYKGINGVDLYSHRVRWFKKCLDQIAEIPDIKSVYFPYKIGCGLAKGNWKDYLKMLNDFAKKADKINVFVVKREGDK